MLFPLSNQLKASEIYFSILVTRELKHKVEKDHTGKIERESRVEKSSDICVMTNRLLLNNSLQITYKKYGL